MKIEMQHHDCKTDPVSLKGELGQRAGLVFIFGCGNILKRTGVIQLIHKTYPAAVICGCSTAGEICETSFYTDSLVVAAAAFDHTRVMGVTIDLSETTSSRNAGEILADRLERDGLRHVFVLSDGIHVNGSDLIRGLSSRLPEKITVTGGLAGDADRFVETVVVRGDVSLPNTVSALGFYGERLKIGYGSMGGWDPFGMERVVTKSEGNVLYELDGKSALDLYKKYLGEHSSSLPASGLLFPLSIRSRDGGTSLVRTVLAVDEKTSSMTFAGDVPLGSLARFMKSNVDRLIDGAMEAARQCLRTGGGESPDLAVLISCVGRRMVMKQRVEEEIEGVQEILGNRTELTGFYSYGEIAPTADSAESRPELHNQTMTITTFSER